jgi:hypothetical protein
MVKKKNTPAVSCLLPVRVQIHHEPKRPSIENAPDISMLKQRGTESIATEVGGGDEGSRSVDGARRAEAA